VIGLCAPCCDDYTVFRSTRWIRDGRSPEAELIRRALEDKGVDVPAAAFSLYEEDVKLLWGFVVTPDERILFFEYDFMPPAPTMTRWDDVTADAGASRHHPGTLVDAARRILAGERGLPS
jgi:hypothetical protein